MLEEARGLRRRGWEVEVWAPNLDKEACFPDFVEEVGVRTLLPQLPKGFPFRDGLLMITTSLLAPLLVGRFREADVFLGANQPGAWLAFCASRILKKPYLVYLNQPNRLVYPREIDLQTGWQTRRDYYLLAQIIKKLRWLIGWLDKVSFTRAGAMLVNGEYIGAVIEQIYGRSVVQAPAGAYWRPEKELAAKPGEAFEGEFEVSGKKVKKPYLLITNRHEPQKRFDYVIRALKEVAADFPKASLVIPGPFTSHTAELQKLAGRLGLTGKVVWTGKIGEEELQRLYREAAVYCYPSPNEDFGLGPVEAGGWGVPTVAWNHGGPTVTVVNGKTGFLAKPYEVKDYAARILALLKEPRERWRMGRAAWRRTKEEFSWENHLDVLEREMEKLILKKGEK